MDIGQKLYQKQNFDEIKALRDKEKLMLDDEGVPDPYDTPFYQGNDKLPLYALEDYYSLSGKREKGEYGTDNAFDAHDPSKIISPKNFIQLFRNINDYSYPGGESPISTDIYRKLGALNHINNPQEHYDNLFNSFTSKDKDASNYKRTYDEYEKQIPKKLSELDDKEKERFINIIKMIKGK